MADFVAYPSRVRRALFVAGAAGFVAIGLWLAGMFGPPPIVRRYPQEVTILLGWACAGFFGLCGALWFVRLFDTGEQLRIDAAGIRYPAWSAQTIPWSEIDLITTWAYRSQNAIILHLRDPALYPGKGTLGLFANANRKLTGGDVAISLTGTDRRFEDALSAVTHFRSAMPPVGQ